MSSGIDLQPGMVSTPERHVVITAPDLIEPPELRIAIGRSETNSCCCSLKVGASSFSMNSFCRCSRTSSLERFRVVSLGWQATIPEVTEQAGQHTSAHSHNDCGQRYDAGVLHYILENDVI